MASGWYVDFRNGKQNIIKIEPEETSLADVPVLRINHPSIDYRLIPIYEKFRSGLFHT